jgi:putative membrane protein
MRPAMVSTWITGLYMAYAAEFYFSYWFIVKICLVVLLTVCHFYMFSIIANFELDQNIRSQKFFRLLNEVPTLLMIGIVSMVIAKPF